MKWGALKREGSVAVFSGGNMGLTIVSKSL